MWSRRRYLASLTTGATAALAGCDVGPLGGSDGADLPPPEGQLLGRRLVTENLVSIADRTNESTPSIGEVAITTPERVLSTPELPAELARTSVRPFGVDPSDVELVLVSTDPTIDVALGEFSPDASTADLPDHAAARGTYRDASLSVWESEETEGIAASAVGPGTSVRLDGFGTRDLAETGLRTILDAAGGADTSTFASSPHDLIVPHLDEGFWQFNWFPPIDAHYRGPDANPGGVSVRADDGTLYRRSVRLYPDEARAERSFLERGGVQRRLREQDYTGPRDPGPRFDSFDVSREGRAVVTTASIGADDLGVHMLQPAERHLPEDLLEPLPR